MRQRTQRALQDVSWQRTGYYMQPLACEAAPPVDDGNDPGYTLPPIVQSSSERPQPWEEGSDPSLRKQRSFSLKQHRSGFWRKAKGTQERAKLNHTLLMLALVIASVLLLGNFLNQLLFTIRSVQVEGNVRLSAEQVMRCTGITEGVNFWSISNEQVEQRIRQNRYLARVVVERASNNSIVLHVTERTQDAYMRYCGITYVLDSHGMVLEQSEESNVQPDMLKLEGLNVKTCTLGRPLALYDSTQLDICRDIMVELKVLSLEREVTELYVGDTNSITIATRSGFSVRMGDTAHIHEKLRAMQLVCNYLASQGLSGGTVDVSTPEEPTWIPGIETSV